MSQFIFWEFMAYMKFCMHVRTFQMDSGAVVQLRPTKCDQKLVNLTLCSEVRGQNEIKFGVLVVTFNLPASVLPSITPRPWKIRLWNMFKQFFHPLLDQKQHVWVPNYPQFFSGIHESDSMAHLSSAAEVSDVISISKCSTSGGSRMAVKLGHSLSYLF